ncbi:leucyl/phenylalanyl-tRNA--protein transferase [Robiginitomaculum antarcticum]|uniref:leucyl/phenylalanyl-tRNA--protein transferase n=1 Tax=Robiginitomaculum antarcticum TaxID=437507 RepID=UPI00035DF163|nr:leucyl/phenylalanyl-tRNA--protein transferase [Robiginitomaculum antarcticum]
MSTLFGSSQLLECYRRGVFPMADSQDDPHIYLLDPDERGIIPLDGLKISRSLAKRLRKNEFTIRFNADFDGTLADCAKPSIGRENTWINAPIARLYSDLHRQGHAHSVEAYLDDERVGGLYGVSIGGAFFGESMFSLRTDASKVALVALVERLNARGFTLLDTQFITDHLRTLGGIEVSRADYQAMLQDAITIQARFD